MSLDLSAVPTLTDDLGLYDIPLQRDTFPYAQLQAQGRYPDRSTPNTLPEFLATLNASDAGFTPDMLSTDGKRNLNVNIAAGGGGGGGTLSAQYVLTDVITWDNRYGVTGPGVIPAAMRLITDLECDVVIVDNSGGQGDPYGSNMHAELVGGGHAVMLFTTLWGRIDPLVVDSHRHISLHFSPAIDVLATFGVTADQLSLSAPAALAVHRINITMRGLV